MVVEPVQAVKIFFCYARQDDALREELAKHLSPLRRLRYITAWCDRDIQAGTDWEHDIETHLDTASIILLLVSADFIDSDYCYTVEMQRALERHKTGSARVIPIILRPVDWEETPIGVLQALPLGAKPVVKWTDRDEAWLNVVQGIREVVRMMLPRPILSQQETGILYPELIDQKVQHPAALPSQILSQPLPQVPRPEVQAPDQSKESAAALPSKTQGGISRRTMFWVLGGGLAGVAGGGLILLEFSRAFPPTSSPHSTPSPIPLGKLLYTYRGHSNIVYAVAWSPNSRRIASGSRDATVQVWDAADGGNAFTYTSHSDIVETVAWSPKGTRIASGSRDATVQVWDATDGGNAFAYRQHSALVRSVAWSPDGTRIASGSYDGTVRVWDASNGNTPLTYTGHHGEVNSVAWSPDGTRIASGSDDGAVQIWDASSGNTLLTYAKHTQSVYAVPWSPNGTRIASGSWDYTVRVWDTSSGNTLLTYTGHDKIWTVVWSPNGTRIASGGQDHTVRVWDASSGNTLLTYTGHIQDVNAVAWSPDGMRIASGSGGLDGEQDNTVQVWGAG